MISMVRGEDLRFIARGLELYGTVPSAEFITRLMGPLSEKDAWDVIAEAERIGMIEHADMIIGAATPEEQEWRLVRGFDMKKLEMPA